MTHNIFRILVVVYMLFYGANEFFLPSLYSQETTKSTTEQTIIANPLDKYKTTLLYGIDASVLQSIKEITKLGIENFESQVLERMKETKNTDIIVAGFDYFSATEYQDALEYSLEIIKNYQKHSNKSIQYATFYINNNPQLLQENDIETLNTQVLQIIDTNIPPIALASTEMIPHYYSEDNIPYIPQDDDIVSEIYNNEMTNPTNENTNPQNITIDPQTLFSSKLKERYDTTNIPILKDQILLTLGQIQAINQIDFIIEIAENTQESPSLRGRAIESLANFENISPILEEKIYNVLETTRGHEIPAIRVSTFQALAVSLQHKDNTDYYKWLQGGLKDNEITVRTQALRSLYTVFKEGKGVSIQDTLFDAIKYIIENDPEKSVQKMAVQTISVLVNNKGNEYILERARQITHLNYIDKALIDTIFNNLADNGGIDAMVLLVKDNIDNKRSSIIEYIATAMTGTTSSNIFDLVEILIEYPSASVTLACLTTIGNNKISSFRERIDNLTNDITQPINIRNTAKKVLSTL